VAEALPGFSFPVDYAGVIATPYLALWTFSLCTTWSLLLTMENELF
jgi:hypothetical protein